MSEISTEESAYEAPLVVPRDYQAEAFVAILKQAEVFNTPRPAI